MQWLLFHVGHIPSLFYPINPWHDGLPTKNRRTMYPEATEGSAARPIGFLERACPVRTAIDVISGRWKPSILQQIHAHPSLYRELLAAIPAISTQALSRHLRELQHDDVVQRGSDGRYVLTARGEQLADVMDGLAEWGDHYLTWREAPR